MWCSSCMRENTVGNTFCIFCGEPLGDEEDQPADSDAGSEEGPVQDMTAAELREQVASLRGEVSELWTTLATYGIRRGASAERAQPSAPRRPAETGSTPSVAGRPAAGRTQSGPPPRRPRTPMPWEGIQVDWELILGGNWLARIGVLAVVIGTGFFLKLAFDNDWIGETGRVALGLVGGMAFLGGGEYWHRRYPALAQALAGGGIALLYLSIFAAFSIFELIGLYPAIGFLALISVGSAALALRYESIALAIIGIFGAFVAPWVTGGFAQESSDVATAGPTIQLLVYVMVIDLGVLALATFRNWRWFTLLALLASLVTFGVWYGPYGDEVSLLASQVSLTIILLIFVGATTLFHIVWRRAPQAFDQSLMVVNAAAYFGISYGLLWADFRLWLGGFTLLLALFYGGVAWLALWRAKEHVVLSLMALGISLVLLTVAVPVQLGGPWVSVAWAAEGAVLIWLSFTLRMWQLRAFGVGAFAVFVGWLLAVDTREALATGDASQLSYLPAYLLGSFATFVAAYLFRRNRESLSIWESDFFVGFLVTGNVLLTLTVPVHVDGIWVAVTWAAEALALVWLSFRLGLRELRLFSFGVFGTLAVRLVVFDTDVDLSDFRLILNERMLAFASGIVALYASAYLVEHGRATLEEWEAKFVVSALLVAATVLTLWVGSAEVIAMVDSGIVDVTGSVADNVKSLSLSLLWAAYAGGLIALGIARRWRYARLGGLALLAIPVFKLFAVDAFELEQGFRVAAFLSLGAILLVGSFLYQRHSTAIRGFLFDES